MLLPFPGIIKVKYPASVCFSVNFQVTAYLVKGFFRKYVFLNQLPGINEPSVDIPETDYRSGLVIIQVRMTPQHIKCSRIQTDVPDAGGVYINLAGDQVVIFFADTIYLKQLILTDKSSHQVSVFDNPPGQKRSHTSYYYKVKAV